MTNTKDEKDLQGTLKLLEWGIQGLKEIEDAQTVIHKNNSTKLQEIQIVSREKISKTSKGVTKTQGTPSQ